MTKDEAEQVRKCHDKNQTEQRARHELQEEFAAKRKKLLKIGARVPADPKNPRSPLFGCRYKPVPPGATYDQPLAKSLLPPGASIWEGRSNGSWQAHLPPHPRISCLWRQYGGNKPAMLEAIASCWRLFLADEGMSLSQCPVEGLPGF